MFHYKDSCTSLGSIRVNLFRYSVTYCCMVVIQRHQQQNKLRNISRGILSFGVLHLLEANKLFEDTVMFVTGIQVVPPLEKPKKKRKKITVSFILECPTRSFSGRHLQSACADTHHFLPFLNTWIRSWQWKIKFKIFKDCPTLQNKKHKCKSSLHFVFLWSHKLKESNMKKGWRGNAQHFPAERSLVNQLSNYQLCFN